ncbi:MAG: RtcB family protein [Sphaerochaetaceae bacterium]
MTIEGKFGEAKVFATSIDSGAREQIKTLLDQDFIKGAKVRIMSDVHVGVGCVIGFTADLKDRVVPNIVGVDIGCGVLTVELGQLKVDLAKLDQLIYSRIPAGKNMHKQKVVHFEPLYELRMFKELQNLERLENSIGTLGGGNHFIELGEDSRGNSYLTIHSGSRNLGTQVARYYQNSAVKMCRTEGLTYPRNLCFLQGKHREAYLHDMAICQEYAQLNRETMATIILNNLVKRDLSDFPSFHSIHNYINFKDNIIRKGAISAYEGERLLIPINMRDGSILGFGRGNRDWNYSAPHGAGRVLSRTEAKAQLTLEAFKKSMEGIYSTSVHKGTLDESPAAYKQIDEILASIGETVAIEEIIKPCYNFKSS